LHDFLIQDIPAIRAIFERLVVKAFIRGVAASAMGSAVFAVAPLWIVSFFLLSAGMLLFFGLAAIALPFGIVTTISRRAGEQ
jgi:hypothetical protein